MPLSVPALACLNLPALLHCAAVAWLEFSALAFGYTDERVIAEASGALHPGNIIGLVGANGGGKTTLLKLLLGDLGAEAGRVQRARETRLAYVAQAASGDEGVSLFEYAAAGRADLLQLDRQQQQLAQDLEQRPADVALAERLGEVQTRFAVLGGHMWELEVERMLLGLSFLKVDFSQPLASLSGGQRQKASLARALLSGSNCFVLDEPTNHLDLQAQEFLAAYLRALPADCAVLLVSHDRWLLDAVCTHIWELDDGVLYRYAGNYSRYLPARDQRRKLAEEEYQRQQEQIARTEEYIRRNIAGQNTRQARGRRTLLGRMQRLERPADDPQLSFVLQPAVATGEQLLLVENLAFSYSGSSTAAAVPTNVSAGPRGLELNPPLSVQRASIGGSLVVEELNFAVYRGERLGIAGPNGCGKSTLLKLLARQLTPQRGLVAWGANAELGIFSQDSADLELGRDALAELRSVDSAISDADARSYLARFGFSGDDVFKLVDSLSGGERSRLSLAKIFRRRPNVLLLDEPTNHLDIYAREALEQFLTAYQGSVILITHDRALLERICDRLLLFEDGPEGRSTTYFRGHYGQWREWRERHLQDGTAAAAGRSTSAAGRAAARAGGSVGAEDPRKLSLQDLQELAERQRTSVAGYISRQREKILRRAAAVEDEIAALEQQIVVLRETQHAADRGGEYQRIGQLQLEIDELTRRIDASFIELEQVAQQAGAWEQLLAESGDYNPRP